MEFHLHPSGVMKLLIPILGEQTNSTNRKIMAILRRFPLEQYIICWLVVSNIFNFHTYLGK